MATLEEILEARDDRYALQTSLIERYRSPLVTCTMNILGPHKNSNVIQAIFDKAMEAFIERNQGVLPQARACFL